MGARPLSGSPRNGTRTESRALPEPPGGHAQPALLRTQQAFLEGGRRGLVFARRPVCVALTRCPSARLAGAPKASC